MPLAISKQQYRAYIAFTTEPFESMSPGLAQRHADRLAEGIAMPPNELHIEVVEVLPMSELERKNPYEPAEWDRVDNEGNFRANQVTDRDGNFPKGGE